MEDLYEKREAAFQVATETQKNLYESPESGEILYQIALAHSLVDTDSHSILVSLVGDTILGFTPQTQLPALISERLNCNQSIALRITADILDFLEPLSETAKKPTTDGIVNQIPVIDTTLVDEFVAVEAAFHDLQPIRTMAQDMESLKHDIEHLHTATSQDVLLSGDGNGKKNPDAAWDTE